MSELLQGQMFPDDADGSTSSPEGFRVRTSPLPGRATDSTVIGRRSSLRSPDLLARSDQIGSSLRTCLRSASEAAIGCSLNWTDSGTPGGRAWWVLGRSGRRTSGTGCGSSGDGWPTPRTLTGGPESAERKQELGRTESGGGDLTSLVQAQNWPTPQNYAKGAEENHEPGLTPLDLAVRPEMPAAIQERKRKGQAARPTASARDWRSPNLKPYADRGGRTKGEQPPNWPTPRSEDSEQTGAHRGEADTLTSKARDWFTPQGRDWKDTGPSQGNRKDVNLGVQAHRCAGPPAPAKSSTSGKHRDWSTPTDTSAGGSTSRGGDRKGETLLRGQVGGQLNQAWVCQLQGLPDGWLDLSDAVLSRLSATRTPRMSRTSSGGG